MATLSDQIAPPDVIGFPVEPITLDEAKAHLRVVFPDDDASIEGMITAARMMLEGRLNRHIAHAGVVEDLRGFEDGMALSGVPYLDGLQIGYIDPDGAAQTFAGEFYLDTAREPARIHLAPGVNWPATRTGFGAVTLRYHVGYIATPAPLKQWMLLAIGTMYEHRATMIAGTTVATIDENFMHWLWQPFMVYA